MSEDRSKIPTIDGYKTYKAFNIENNFIIYLINLDS